MASQHHLAAANLFNLAGKVAVVTGGATGIGLMIAETLAANNATVYIIGRRSEKLDNAVKHYDTEAHNGKIVALQGDLTTKDHIRKVRDEIAQREGHISILVNNHGINQKDVDVSKQDPEEISEAWFEGASFEQFEDIYRTDVISYYFTTSAFIGLLAKGVKKFGPESSVVLSIASMSGQMNQTQSGQWAYNSAKAATAQLVQLLAHELSRDSLRIRSVGIHPGYFPSEMTLKEESDEHNKNEQQVGKEFGEKKGVPAQRQGSEEDMAQLALCLVANRYINGELTRIDGGHQIVNA